MNPAIIAREFHILTTVGGMPADEAIEFISKAASAAKGDRHQNYRIPDMPGGACGTDRRPVLSRG